MLANKAEKGRKKYLDKGGVRFYNHCQDVLKRIE
jgi:hypothetical protein